MEDLVGGRSGAERLPIPVVIPIFRRQKNWVVHDGRGQCGVSSIHDPIVQFGFRIHRGRGSLVFHCTARRTSDSFVPHMRKKFTFATKPEQTICSSSHDTLLCTVKACQRRKRIAVSSLLLLTVSSIDPIVSLRYSYTCRGETTFDTFVQGQGVDHTRANAIQSIIN